MIFNVFLHPLLNKGEEFNEYEFGCGEEIWRTEVISMYWYFSSAFHPLIDKTEFHLTF